MSNDRELQKTVPDDPKLSALYHRTRIETSGAALDESIRGAARRVARRRRYRWLLPLSSAAVVLLGLSLTFKFIELDRPIEESTLSEMDVAEPKSKTTSMSDRAEAVVPAPPSTPYALRELRVGDTQDSDPVRKRSRAPTGGHDREERPSLILDQTAKRGASTLSLAPSGELKSGAPKAESIDRLKNDPTLWLQHIRELISQDRTAEATAQLANFRTGYPHYPLPDDLAGLLDP